LKTGNNLQSLKSDYAYLKIKLNLISWKTARS